jgi:hypothetical protein
MNDLKNTDAVILMQFRDAVSSLRDLPLADATAQLGVIGFPFLEQLKTNGHEWPDALALLRAVWLDIKKGGQ